MFKFSGQLAGQLWGHCCPELTCAHGILNCDHVAGWVTKYGEFDTTYPIIEQWLKIGGTIRVNGANITPPWYGTPADPFWSVSQANGFAWDGARIKIQAGSYSERLTFSKELTVLAAGGTVTIGE